LGSKNIFLAGIHFADKQTVGYVKCLFSPVSSVLSVRVVACVPDRNMDFNDRGNQVYYYYFGEAKTLETEAQKKRTSFSPPSSINYKRILKILSRDSH